MNNQASVHDQQSGQAMTEVVIVLALVLLPLILALPFIGKYADMNLASVEAARYVAWERSVWHDSGGFLPEGSDHSSLPKKSSRDIQNEVRSRFFGDTNRVIRSTGGRTLSQGELNTFWHDAQGAPLVMVSNVNAAPPTSSDTPGIGYDVMRGFTTLLNLIYTPLSWLGGSANFSPNLDGYHHGEEVVQFDLEQPDNYFREMIYTAPTTNTAEVDDLSTINISFDADASLIVDSWSVQGSAHFQNQTGGLVPTSMLNFPLLNTLRDIAATILLEPKLKQPSPGQDTGLNMGGFNTEPFSLADDKDSKQFCDKNGYCSFNENL